MCAPFRVCSLKVSPGLSFFMNMSDSINGFGPAGARYPHMLVLQGTTPTAMGTEVTLFLDDAGWITRLYVSFPPDDPEWQDKYIDIVEGGTHPLRRVSVVVPPGCPIVAFRPIDEEGEAIAELCGMYRIVQQDWLQDVAPERKVRELVNTEDQELDEVEEIDKRLYFKGASFNCCLCGTIVGEDKGYTFDSLSSDQVRAIKMMSTVSEQFPFICKPCYRKNVGLSQQALGSATWMQGGFIWMMLILMRGYLGVLVATNYFKVRQDHHVWIAAAIGSAISFELLPGMIFQLIRHPIMMIFTFLAPVALIGIWFMRPEAVGGILSNPLILIGFNRKILDFPLMYRSLPGSFAGMGLGLLFNFLDPRNKKPKKPNPNRVLEE